MFDVVGFEFVVQIELIYEVFGGVIMCICMVLDIVVCCGWGCCVGVKDVVLIIVGLVIDIVLFVLVIVCGIVQCYFFEIMFGVQGELIGIGNVKIV